MMTATVSSAPSLVSTRIEADDGHRGTVRFHAAIPGLDSTEWLGIEWDDPLRGRHSGAHPKDPTLQLFSVTVPGSGSFIKAATIASGKTALPRAFVAALREKYLDDSVSLTYANEVEAERSSGLKTRAAGQAVEAEMVGWEKMRKKLSNLGNITILGLAGMQVGWVSSTLASFLSTSAFTPLDQSPNAILKTCPSVEDLDLSRNLFASWQEVAKITVQLPKLESLRLNSSRLVFLDTEHDLMKAGFACLKVLALNSTNLPWSQMERLAPFLPNLTALHFGFNQLTNFGDETKYPSSEIEFLQAQTSTPLFPKLESFHAESNQLTSWHEIANLVATHMPRLTWLNLSDNRLTTILPDFSDRIFPHLMTFNIAANQITTYSAIHALNSFPALSDIRLRDNPVFLLSPPTLSTPTVTSTSTVAHTSKSDELTARLANATRINGKHITARDRTDAELYYLSKVAHWVAAHAPSAIMLAAWHPRYADLVARYGAAELAPASATSTALRDRLVALAFVLVECGAEAATGDAYLGAVVRGKRVEKRIPVGMTMRALRALGARVLGVSGKALRMKGVVGCKSERPMVVDMEEEMREVGYYEFEAGDEIHVLCD